MTLRPLSLLILPVTLGLGACVEDNADSALIILRAVAPDDGCVFSTETSEFVTSGVIQSDSVGGYLIGPEVRNDLTLREGEGPTSKTVFVNGAEVEIRFYDEDLFSDSQEAELTTEGITRFLAPLSGVVDPNGGSAVFPFEAVPDVLLRRIDAVLPQPSAQDPSPSTVLDVRIRLIGTRGGSGIESNLFRFPVEVCSNCTRRIIGDCTDIAVGAVVGIGGACRLLQDGILDCCTRPDPESPLVCPARPPEL